MLRTRIGLWASLVVAGCSGSASEDGSGRGILRRDGGDDAANTVDVSNTFSDDGAVDTAVGPTPDAAVARCGDGRVDPGEACDEGERNGGSEPGACRADCSVPSCGDRVVDPGESCDTGELLSDVVSDACRVGCTAFRCGDGVVDTGEQCDDGPGNSDQAVGACRTSCQRASCGDGVLDVGEACDSAALRSDTSAGACRLDCSRARCGDAVVDLGEACDRGSANSDFDPDACRLDCQNPRCGDGVVDTGESCDTGMARRDDLANACRVACTVPHCGDGVIDTGEACDDGNPSDADACRNDCSVPSCGDGKLDAGESCDDGNRVDADGCQASCLLPVCGDGVNDTGESCDDGNAFDNDGCRANCMIGCIGRAQCSDGAFCNGEEECVNGICQPGTPPKLDDMVACTSDRCDEDADTVAHDGSDGLCTANPASCELGLRTSYAAMCVGATGCQQVSRVEACPDQASTCMPGAGLDLILTSFTASCAGADCGLPAATTRTCAAPPPSCDPVARVGTITRATCDAPAEACGTLVSERNDCTLLDARSCSPDGASHRIVLGQCTSTGGCSSESTEARCDAPVPSCQDGHRNVFVPSCDPERGCGPAQPLPAETCPSPGARCEGTGAATTYLRHEPSCADATSCALEGAPVRLACAGAEPSCDNGTVTTFSPSCDPERGCGAPVPSGTIPCPAAAASCAPSPDGFVHTRFAPGCDGTTRCAADGVATTTSCLGAPPACDQGTLTTFAASCDPALGCGAPALAASAACPANPPVCAPTADGFIHLRYAPACADGGSCALEGAATMSICSAPGALCVEGVISTMSPVCDPVAGCGVVTMPALPCPVAPARCTATDDGFTLTRFRAVCADGLSCAPQGLASDERCSAPASRCANGTLTKSSATCDPDTGCGVTSELPMACPALPSRCEPAPGGYALTRYAPTCSDGETCALLGAPSTEACVASGPVCSNGVLSGTTASCDPTTGCGTVPMPSVPCAVAAPVCGTGPDGSPTHTTFAPSCADGASCLGGGVPTTVSCVAPAPVCRDGALTTFVPTCSPEGGCGFVEAVTPCASAAAACSYDPYGTFVDHVAASGGCNPEGTACSAGGMGAVQRCVAQGPSCTNGVEHRFALSCTPGVGCANVETTTPCAAGAAECIPGAAWIHRAYASACDPASGTCSATGTPIDTTCGGGAAVCATQNGQAGLTAQVASCDPATGCGLVSTPFMACPASTEASCDGLNRVTSVATCEAGVCGTTRMAAPCPGQVVRTCGVGEGSSSVLESAPTCTGAGQCGYEAARVVLTCDYGCANGACVDDPCKGMACPYGCQQGVCNPDPCAGVVCDDVVRCDGAGNVTTSVGSCVRSIEPTCGYAPATVREACAYGCEGGKCLPMPPENKCANVSCDRVICDGDIQRKQTGTCVPSTGACGSWVNAAGSVDCAALVTSNPICVTSACVVGPPSDAGGSCVPSSRTEYNVGICVSEPSARCGERRVVEDGCIN